MTHSYRYEEDFPLEKGGALHGISISYCTYGSLNSHKNNVIWVCHALTANADITSWWPGMVGAGCVIDTDKYFVVCANIVGSCYGTTGPHSVDSNTGVPYFHNFPFITIRDMVNAHRLLRRHLGIERIHLMIGGSMGGYQAMEWAMMEPGNIDNLFLSATSAQESAWGIAIHTAQRLAIEADTSWRETNTTAGTAGLMAARAIGMLTYRNYEQFALQQTDSDINKTIGFKADSYITYQSQKLVNRFNAHSYYTLTRAMDSHNIARDRYPSIEEALRAIKHRTLLIGISSDFLCPIQEQRQLAEHLPNVTFVEIDSSYGHDGFLTETQKIGIVLKGFLDT